MAATRCRGGTRLHFFELVMSEDEIWEGLFRVTSRRDDKQQ